MRTLTILFIGVLCAGTIPARADVPDSLGTIVGRVVADSGRAFHVVVPGTKLEAETDHEGRFVITLVPFGRYTLQVSANERSLTRDVTVGPGVTRIEDIAFAPSAPIPLPERLGIGSRAEAADLVLEVRPFRSTYKFGDSPRFEVRIRNRGTTPVLLVKCGAASDAGASPRGEWKIAAPFDGYEHVRGGVTSDSGRRGLSAADFVEVAPGEAFDPYMDGLVPNALADGAVTRPGKYTANFRYSTKDPSPRAWLGPDARDVAPDILELLARVPAVELTAKTNFKVDY